MSRDCSAMPNASLCVSVLAVRRETIRNGATASEVLSRMGNNQQCLINRVLGSFLTVLMLLCDFIAVHVCVFLRLSYLLFLTNGIISALSGFTCP